MATKTKTKKRAKKPVKPTTALRKTSRRKRQRLQYDVEITYDIDPNGFRDELFTEAARRPSSGSGTFLPTRTRDVSFGFAAHEVVEAIAFLQVCVNLCRTNIKGHWKVTLSCTG